MIATWHVLDGEAIKAHLQERRKTPASDYLHDLLREPLRPLISSDTEYSDRFDDLEYLLGVVCAGENSGRGPVGRFAWRRHWGDYGGKSTVLDDYGDELVGMGLFGGDPQLMIETETTYLSNARHASFGWIRLLGSEVHVRLPERRCAHGCDRSSDTQRVVRRRRSGGVGNSRRRGPLRRLSVVSTALSAALRVLQE